MVAKPASERRTWIKAPDKDSVADPMPVEGVVAGILQDVRERGGAAVRDYSAKFGQAEVDVFEVTARAREEAVAALDPQTRADTEFRHRQRPPLR